MEPERPEPQRELTFNGGGIVRLRVDYEGRKKNEERT
jgi:hypothetical protein